MSGTALIAKWVPDTFLLAVPLFAIAGHLWRLYNITEHVAFCYPVFHRGARLIDTLIGQRLDNLR